MKQLISIIVPVFNEEKTLDQVLTKLKHIDTSPWQKEIIIVDDGSTDKTVEIAKKHASQSKEIFYITHEKNKGKGSAVQNGMGKAKGDYILIQDADLEYNPDDIPMLLKPVHEKRSDVVYGTRLKRLPNFKHDERTFRFFLHYLGNRSLSLLTSLLYGQYLTDIETGYKIFPKKALKNMSLTSKGFEFEPEITIQLVKQGFRIHEVPIRTNPRGYEKGKKLRTIPDGIKALRMILKHL